MTDTLRILILEDRASDAAMMERELRGAGIVFTSKRVETREAFLKAMTDFSPDIVLSDYSLPQFTGGEALALVRERFPEIPVIIVTGTLTDETAVECIKSGADNYVIKEHLVRLGPAVISALENKRIREEKKAAEEALRLAAIQWRTTFDAISDAVCLLDVEGKVMRCNQAMRDMADKPWSEILGHPCHESIHNAPFPIEDCPRIRMLKSGQKETAIVQAGERWFDVRVDPIMDEQRRIVGAVQIMSDITDHKRAEEALRESEQEFRSLAESMPQIVWVTRPDGWNIYFNQQWVEYTGLTLEQSYGHGWNTPFHPDDRQRAWVAWQRATKNDETYSVECRLRRADGIYRWWLVRGVPLRNASGEVLKWFGTCTDIEEIKRAEEALGASEIRYRRLFEAAKDGILILDADTGAVVDVNPFLVELLSIPREQILGQKIWELGFLKDVAASQDKFEELQQHEYIRYDDLPLETSDGRHIAVEFVSNVYEVNHHKVIQCNIRDITERKRAQEELRKLEAQMQQTQKLESLGVLAGGIAHDFSNLLMGVIGNAELALKELPLATLGRERIVEIQAEARRATDLCRQLLAYSGKGRFVVEPIDLNALVKEMGQMLQVSVSKKAVLQYRLSQYTLVIEADATQVRQIVMNLVINASDAVGDKSGYITIATGIRQCDRAFLNGASLGEPLPEGSYVFVEVSDTGCGMTEETKARIFEPFFTTKFTGRGLGLAAALGIIKGHKGAITVASELGKGTAFTVLFPASLKPVAVAPAKAAAKDKDKEEWRGHGTILVVDDEKNVRVIAKIHLEDMGFTVLTAEDGRQGLHLFREHSDDIVLVLLDLTMPEMGGEETFQEIIRIKEDARVILSSGYSEHDIISHFDDKGLAGFIQKPYERADLIAVVRRALEKEEA